VIVALIDVAALDMCLELVAPSAPIRVMSAHPGWRMQYVSGWMGLWRRLTAAVLVCALVLQGVAFALTSARLIATTVNTDWAGVEICHHDGGASRLPGSVPDTPLDCARCIFCLAGAVYVFHGPTPRLDARTLAVAIVSWPRLAWRLPARRVDAAAWPRGPPLAE